MTRTITWTITLLVTTFVLLGQTANGQPGKGVANGKKGSKTQSWRVAYEKGSPHPHTLDHALRLQVARPSGNNLTATLSRYTFDDTVTPPIYRRRPADRGGIVNLTGIVSKSGDDGTRKREQFVLSGYYTDSTTSTSYEVKIRGYHWPGKDKSQGMGMNFGPRSDDQLCVRISHKELTGAFFAPVRVVYDSRDPPCDEQPPDEDIMTEEDAPTSDDSEPYDGG